MMSNANADEGAAREPRVLVIDDDALVGKAIGRVLRPFRVTFAQSATGALARIQAGGDFQAIVCDLFMPGMNGMQFHQELTSFAPPLASRIVFLTGNRGAPEVASFLRRTGNACLDKPFDLDALRAAVWAAASHRD